MEANTNSSCISLSFIITIIIIVRTFVMHLLLKSKDKDIAAGQYYRKISGNRKPHAYCKHKTIIEKMNKPRLQNAKTD